MKKSTLKNPNAVPKAGGPDKQINKSDPVAMVELRGQIISEYNESIRSFNAGHK
ncbi:MAG TPA: hypothetical protein VGD22_09990 [Sphingobacteriaceae bacterium]